MMQGVVGEKAKVRRRGVTVAVVGALHDFEVCVGCSLVETPLGGWRGRGWPPLGGAEMVDPSLGVDVHVARPRTVVGGRVQHLFVTAIGARDWPGGQVRQGDVEVFLVCEDPGEEPVQ